MSRSLLLLAAALAGCAASSSPTAPVTDDAEASPPAGPLSPEVPPVRAPSPGGPSVSIDSGAADRPGTGEVKPGSPPADGAVAASPRPDGATTEPRPLDARAALDSAVTVDVGTPPASGTWAGGPAYRARWTRGLPADPTYFPLAVWMQTPTNAPRYQKMGINLFTGLWDGPTEAQLKALAGAGMPTICAQEGAWAAHATDPVIRGWLQPDEPDNAQSLPGGGYGPCIPPEQIVAGYRKMVAADPTRPVYLGFGRAVADTKWVGRGSCTGRTDMYPEYAKGADIVGFDIYPVNEGAPLEIVAAGVDNLRRWVNDAKPVIAVIEGSNFNATHRPSPAQIRTEVWMALVHGAAGIEYFCHRFKPTFSETDCLDDAPTAAALTAINAQITALAPALNSLPVSGAVTVQSSAADVPVDTSVRKTAGGLHLFAVAMRGRPTTATFTVTGVAAKASAEVLGEGRTIDVVDGKFHDDFAGYGVHLYRIAP